ncbi:MAG: NAD(P)/FAD-dependent oxidoreductase [Elusimicrobia bacterium]|nr:NAD(P)/FAD-dependent oxidoreductase [Elusimicrobiota bacterium]
MIGAGPAGLAAAAACARYGRRALVLDPLAAGGQAASLGLIENFPGFPDGIRGDALMRRFEAQAARWGARLERRAVLGVRRRRRGFEGATLAGSVAARAVILATGARFAPLGVAGEWGRPGVLHGGLAEAPRLRGRVCVAGGGEGAAYQALACAGAASRVTLVFPGRRLKAHALLRRRLAQARVRLRPGRRVVGFAGSGRLDGVWLSRAGRRERLAADWLLVLTGKRPRASLARGARGPGFFVAGDARGWRYRQVAIAAADGVRAAMDCEAYLNGHR